MADESMVRNLAAQIEAIWPQELPLLRRYQPRPGRVLDVGCGTGEWIVRAAGLWPQAEMTGIDLIEDHLALAREKAAQQRSSPDFQKADASALPFPDDHFDLVACRHVLQSVPDAAVALEEMIRVTRPGGFLHLLCEDYGMIHMAPTRKDSATFWFHGPPSFGRAVGTDLHVGRRAFHLLKAAGVESIALDYIVVDTIRVPRETMTTILVAWRDGFSEAIAQHAPFDHDEVLAYFNDMIECTRDPNGYAVWQVPIASGQVPAGSTP